MHPALPTLAAGARHRPDPATHARRRAAARAARCALLALAGAAPLTAQTGINLLANPGFENGVLAPWSVVAGSAGLANYGAPNAPDTTVAAAIGGGFHVLRDSSNAIVEQLVTPTSIPPGASLIVEGFLGGVAQDDARLVVRFLDAAGTQLAFFAGDWVTPVQRNFEGVLLARRIVAAVPPTATRFAVRVEFRDNGCCSALAAADEFSATLVTGSTMPAPFALGAELLLNPGFEAGWAGGSPLTLVGPRGWEGGGGANTLVKPYSDSDPTVPNGIVSCIVAGAAPNPSCGSGAAGNLLAHTGTTALRQRIDVRGNTPQFTPGATALRVAAYLGGTTGQDDTARVEFECRNAAQSVLASGLLPPVTAAQRNQEPVLLRREGEIPVPPGTAFIDVIVAFTDTGCCTALALADNVSAKLVAPTPPAPVPLNVNLLANPNFENGSVPGSPLELTNPTGWYGTGGARCQAVVFGLPETPPIGLANANGLSAKLLRDGSNSTLQNVIDLTGSANLIAQNRMGMQLAGWLGGYANIADSAEVRLHFETIAGVTVGPIQSIGPVTAAQRANVTTLLQRTSAPFAVPQNAARAVVDLIFTDTGCCSAHGFADDIRLVAFDTTQQTSASPFPGTGGDFVLLTGVDELPRTGIGHYVKTAQTGDVLRTVVGSPNGTADGSPVVLALNLFPTGGPLPAPFLPQYSIDPFSALFAYFGLNGGVFAPVVLPLAQGGNQWNTLIPPGFPAGWSILLQALCLPLPGVPAPNGLYFTSEGHEIRVL